MRALGMSLLAGSLLMVMPVYGQQHSDDSDWWSNLRTDSYGAGLKPGADLVPPSIFTVGGITLGESEFKDAEAEFGQTTEVTRGDGASGRQQRCYVSESGEPIFLIFEFGEVEEVFYLFKGGPSWNGVELCRKSTLIDSSIATNNGIHLGMARGRVEAILGRPTKRAADEDIFWNQARIRNSDEDLSRLRAQQPDMSEQEFRENFEYVDRDVFIQAKFAKDELVFLCVMRSESY